MTEPNASESNPSASEKPSYEYVFRGTDGLKALSDQQREIGQLLERLTDEQATTPYETGKWTIKQLLGHLVDTERIMAFRALAFARGEKGELPGFDENSYVANANFNEQPLAHLLIQYHAQRTASVQMFASFTPELYERRGVANGKERSVREIMRLIAAHEQHHIDMLRQRYLTMWY